MLKKEIELLFEYDKWADIKMLGAAAGLNPDQYKKDLGSSFGGIHGTIVHILSANHVWCCRWTGKISTPLKAEDIPSIEVVKKQWDTYHFEIGNFFQNLSDKELNESSGYTDFKGNSYSYPLYQQMLHKVNHSTYHRGQVVTLLRQLGTNVFNSDFINFIRQKESNG